MMPNVLETLHSRLWRHETPPNLQWEGQQLILLWY
jgi:hypothetical protein